MPGKGAASAESQKSTKGVLRITNVSAPTLEVFKAPGAKGPAPAVIICPGGGYQILAYDLEGTEVAAWLNKLGITGIILKYRVPNNRDGAFDDMQRAVRVARAHAAEWGIQPDKLGVIGFSAGGHLAARLSTNYEKTAYAELDETDKVNCRPDYVMLLYPGYLNDSGKVAAELPITPSMPGTLLIVAADDEDHVDDSKVFDKALSAANVPHQLIVYPKGGHGFGLRSQTDPKVWPTQAADWLRKMGVL